MWNRNGNSRTRFRDIRPMFNEPHCRERRIVAVVLELIFSPLPSDGGRRNEWNLRLESKSVSINRITGYEKAMEGEKEKNRSIS